jgi:hypothetical protein
MTCLAWPARAAGSAVPRAGDLAACYQGEGRIADAITIEKEAAGAMVRLPGPEDPHL